MSASLGRKSSGPCKNSRSCLRFRGKILLLLFVLSLAVCPSPGLHPRLALQITQLREASSSTFNSIPIPDFSIQASSPMVVVADGTTTSTSVIIVNPFAGFSGTVILSHMPLPTDLTCSAIRPPSILNGSGQATLSCSSVVPRIYAVTIVGSSGGIYHNATATFTFVASTSPDFTITAISPVSLTLGTIAISNVTVSPQGGFHSQVNFTVTVYPSTGLSVSLEPQHLALGSGELTATFNSTTPGDYTVTITATSDAFSHATTIIVAATLVGVPDFEMSSSSSSLNLEEGSSGSTKITITPENGFTGTATLIVASPTGISCGLSSTNIESSGTSTLTCNSSTAGNYAVTIMANGGARPHTATVNVYVAAPSPASPVPSPIAGLAPAIFYGTMVGIIVVIVVAGTVLILRSRRSTF